MADYSGNYEPGKDYRAVRYPVTGWGQVFQEHFDTTKVKVDDRARGGRSTRTFFQEGRWRAVYEVLRPGDLVMIQFGHNDAAENYPDRYVNLEGYKEYLRLFVSQAREKGALPVILTPVARNYPWKDGHLENVHGEYPAAAAEVAREMEVALIDLNWLSMDAFSAKGQEYVSDHYFMNLPPGKFPAYPDGQSDNTHFQTEGAREVARLVYQEMVRLDLE